MTYYGFNTSREPFDDVRVREALALAIDRERISRDELAARPNLRASFFLKRCLAKSLLSIKRNCWNTMSAKRENSWAQAGYPNGEGFPVIRLLINRNEQQSIVAQSIAGMWRSALNLETEIVIRNWDEYEAAIMAGDYDIVRRGMVMQTTSELINIRMMFERDAQALPTASPSPESSPLHRRKRTLLRRRRRR